MLRPHIVMLIMSIGLMVLRADIASGQNYPNKTIRIVTGEARGNADFTSRLIAQGLIPRFRQQVVVENHGGSVIIAAKIVTQASPDGYTLLLHGSNVWLLPFLQDNVPYNPVRDFSPVTVATSAPTVLVVYSSVPVESVKELIALAKSRPGALNYASGAAGTSTHLAAELFIAMARVNIARISYKGTSPALNALISGQVQLMFSTAAPVKPHVQSGRLRALAVTSAQPSALFPGLPTVAASGFPGYEFTTILGLFAPRATPVSIVNLLNQEITQVLNNADVKQRFFNAGVEVVNSSPKQFAALIKSDMARIGKIIKDASVRAD